MVIHLSTRRGVIKSYLNNLSRLENAAKHGISTGSVSNIIKEYEEALAIVDLTAIRKALTAIRKSGSTINECAEASQFLILMKEFHHTTDIKDSEDFQKFIANIVQFVTDLYKSSIKNSIPPAIIPSWIKDLQDFAPIILRISKKPSKLDPVSDDSKLDPVSDDSKLDPVSDDESISPATISDPVLTNSTINTKIPFVSAISSYIENVKRESKILKQHKDSLTEYVGRLKAEKTTLETNIEQLYQKEKEAMRYFAWFCKLEKELDNNPFGVQIDDIDHFAKLMNEFALRGYDANDILSELAHLESAPIKIMIMEREFAKLLDKKNTIERNIKFYESRISEYLETILRVDYLEIMGFGYDHLVWLTKIIERISKIENISLKRAANKLLKDIDLQY